MDLMFVVIIFNFQKYRGV